jgi:Effector protein
MPLQTLTQAYVGYGNRQELPAQEGEAFREAVNVALTKITSYPIGADMVREINQAAQHVLVVKAAPGQQNRCVMVDSGKAALDAACYLEAVDSGRLQQKLQSLRDTKNSGVGPDHPAVRKYEKFYGPNTVHLERMGKDEKSFPIAHRGTDPARKAAHTTEKMLRTRVSQPMIYEPKDVAQGIALVRSLQNGLVAYHVMEHLTPGPGADAVAVWDPDCTDAGLVLGPDARAAWMQRPSWIALAHEMIHAWRIATGRCVFYPDPRIEEYYEEAMTVGLPPYERCSYTENRFRQAGGEAPRTFYGPSTRVLTEAAAAKIARSAQAAKAMQ